MTMIPVPAVNLDRVPKHWIPVALVALDIGPGEQFGYNVQFNGPTQVSTVGAGTFD